MRKEENEETDETNYELVKKKIDGASEKLTSQLTKFTEEFQDLPTKLDNAFEYTLDKQRKVASDLNDSFSSLKSLKRKALLIVVAIGATQFISDFLVWKFFQVNFKVILGGVLVLALSGILVYKFHSNTEWGKLNKNSADIQKNLNDLKDKQTEVSGGSLKNNIYSIFSEFKTKILYNVKSVFDAAITFSSYGKLYRESLDYFDSLQRFKDSFVRMLYSHNIFRDDYLIKFLNEFSGDNIPEKMWINKIVEEIKGLCDVDPSLLKLYYFETVNRNEENANSLMQLKKDNRIDLLINHLVYSELITTKFEYPEEWIAKILSTVIFENETFYLPQIRAGFEYRKQLIQLFFARFERMTRLYEIEYPTPISRDFSPENILNFEEEYLFFISQRIGISKQITNLLFYSVWDEMKTGQLFTALLNNSDSEIDNLSKFFLEHHFKSSKLSYNNFTRIILSLPEFKLSELKHRVNVLEQVVMFEEQYRNFLINNNFSYELKGLELNHELINLAADTKKSLFTKYLALSELMISLPDFICERSLYHSVLLMVFLNDISSPEAKEINDEALRQGDVLLALYKFINISQDSSPEDRLRVISEAIRNRDPKDEQDPVYSEFVFRLQSGQFIRYIPSLMSPMLKEISKQYKDLQEQDSYSKIDKIMGKLFARSIGREQIIKMLSGNLIESYLVTVPSKGQKTEPIITLITDSPELMEAQKELAFDEKDPTFNGLIKVASAGTHTRIGIIPEGTTFSSFAIKFEKILRRILEKLEREDYPVYLTRVSASPQMTSVVMDSRKNDSSPYLAIRKLAELTLPREKLAALYAITNIRKIGKVGVLDLVSNIIDSDIGGVLNIIPEIPPKSILSKDSKTTEKLKNEINNQLCEQFSAASTTELCKNIAHQSSKSRQDETLSVIRNILFGLEQIRNEKEYIEEIAKKIIDVALSISKLMSFPINP